MNITILLAFYHGPISYQPPICKPQSRGHNILHWRSEVEPIRYTVSIKNIYREEFDPQTEYFADGDAL